MEEIHEESFVVFVRPAAGPLELPQPAEEPLAVCSSYAEARQVRKGYQSLARVLVIRYIGPAGGGD